MSIYKLINLIFPEIDLSKVKLFDYQKSLLENFVTFPEPVKVTFQFTDTSKVLGSHKTPQGDDQTQKATTTPLEDPIASEDKFEPHRGYYGYSVKTFKNPSIQEIIEWNFLSSPWVHEARSASARKNRFKRLRLVKRKIDERN